MKTRILLALCAIIIAVIAVGCSDSGRTTAPVNTVEKLNIPNSTDANRFEQIAVAKDHGPEPGYYVLTGTYSNDASGCQSLQLNKSTLVEVTFVYAPPRDLRSGQVVQVTGQFGAMPGGHCQYSRLFHIEQITIIADRLHEMKRFEMLPQ